MGLVAASPASANDFRDVYNYYKKHNTIRPCQFSESELRGAERQTPPDVEQYAPSFLDALAAAREQSSNCSKGSTRAAAPAPTPAPTPPPTASTPTPAPSTTPQPAAQPAATAATPAPQVPAAATGAPALDTRRAKRDTSTPAPLWILAVVAVLVVGAALAAWIAWWFGWSPERWARPLGASWTDFGSRFGEASREFGDWLRTGH